MRFLITEVLPLLLVFFLLRPLLRSLFAPASAPRRPEQPPQVSPGGELKKDPVCGTYVSTAASVQSRIGGEIVHFCSADCRDRYRK
jgi:YHS domain-containing protein